MKPKLIRVTTVPQSLWKLLEGQLKFMGNHFEIHAISSPGDKLDIVRDREGVTIHPILMERGISIINDTRSIWKLYRYFKVERPSIVHSHTPKAGLVSMVAAYYAGVPVRLHTVAGMPLESRSGFKRKLLLFVEKLCYKFADRVYPNSIGLKEFIVKNNLCSAEKLKIIGHGSSNGIDLDHFSINDKLLDQARDIRKSLGIPKDEKLVGFIGRLVKDKGVNELVEAFLKLEKDNSVSMLLLGKFEESLDPLKPEVKHQIENNSKIYFVGYQKDVRPYLLAMDLFVFPSYREGLPNVLLQAGAMERPIVATYATGNTDIIQNELNGILVPAQDSIALGNAMLKLILNTDLAQKYCIEIRKTVEKNYKRNIYWNHLLDEYNKQLGSDKG